MPHEITVTDTGSGGYPWLLECTCGFRQARSEEALAIAQGREHVACTQCAAYWAYDNPRPCSQPCRHPDCLGHCQQWCDECQGHETDNCYCSYCSGHCSYECAQCGGHCEHTCEMCDWEHCRYECADCDTHHNGQEDNGELIHDYGYKPEPIFNALPLETRPKLFIGMELEVSWNGSPRQWVERYVKPYESIWYAKTDTSVRYGIEVVTHPMTLPWANNGFPYEWVRKGLDMGAIPDDSSCGTHIHISRAGLNARQWWVLFAIHRKLAGLCGWIGGRGTESQWASWDYGQDILRNPIASKYNPTSTRGGRYVPVNVQNEDTIELRYPKGDFTPEGIRRNVQWIEVLTSYGLGVPIGDIRITEGNVIDHIRNGHLNEDRWHDLYKAVAIYSK